MKTMTNQHSAEPAKTDKAPQPEQACDDRYPGSFFRVPGVPQPGKTRWVINKLQ